MTALRGSVEWFRQALAPFERWLKGLDDDQLREVAALNGPLPLVYENFLRVAGANGGRLWQGDDFFYPRLLHTVEVIEDIRQEEARGGISTGFVFPEGAALMGHHHGYQVYYLVGDSDDPPVYMYDEGKPDPFKLADSFTDYVLDSIELVRNYEIKHLANGRKLLQFHIDQTRDEFSHLVDSDASIGTLLELACLAVASDDPAIAEQARDRCDSLQTRFERKEKFARQLSHLSHNLLDLGSKLTLRNNTRW